MPDAAWAKAVWAKAAWARVAWDKASDLVVGVRWVRAQAWDQAVGVQQIRDKEWDLVLTRETEENDETPDGATIAATQGSPKHLGLAIGTAFRDLVLV